MTFLVIGQAVDGKIDTVFKSNQIEDYYNFYNAFYTQSTLLTGAATGVYLDYIPFGSVTSSVSGYGKDWLYQPQLADNYLTFGNPGGIGGLQTTIQFYPYFGYNDLLAAINTFFAVNDTGPYSIRVPGYPATLDYGSWEFSAPNASRMYNYYGVNCDGTTLTVINRNTLETNSYHFTSQSGVDSLNSDFNKGICPIYCSSVGSFPFIYTGVLTGGTDGVVSPNNLSWILTNVDIPSDVDSILVLDYYSDSYGTVIQNYLSSGYTPKMFYFAGSTDNITVPTLAPSNKSPYCSIVYGFSEVPYNISQTRFSSELLAASLEGKNVTNVTNFPIATDNFSPVYNQSQLDSIYTLGYMGLVNKIRNGVTVYQGTTTDKTNSFVYNNVVCRLWGVVSKYLTPYKFKFLPIGNQPKIETDIGQLILGVDNFNFKSIDVNVISPAAYDLPTPLPEYNISGDILTVYIEGSVFNEILSIQITIQTQK